MQKTFLILWMLCACSAFRPGDSDHPRNVKYSKYQRAPAGYWRVTEADQAAKLAWLVPYLRDSPNTMAVRWPTGLGCQNEPAEIKKDTITVVGRNFPGVIHIQGSK